METGLGMRRGEPENMRKWLVRKNRAADSQHGWLQLWGWEWKLPLKCNLGKVMALRQHKPDYCRIEKRESTYNFSTSTPCVSFLPCLRGMQFGLCVHCRAYDAMAQHLSLSGQKLNFLLVFHCLKLHLKICGHSSFNHLPDFTV